MESTISILITTSAKKEYGQYRTLLIFRYNPFKYSGVMPLNGSALAILKVFESGSC